MAPFLSALLLLLTATAPPEPATVNRVIDGDTLDVSLNGIRTPVGLLAIVAPPLNAPCGPEALDRLSQLVADGVLLAPSDPLTLDARRRVLYSAFTPDGAPIADTLVAEGLAHAAPDADTLVGLEQDAQANQVGCLWSQGV